jgi:hypothetical protein
MRKYPFITRGQILKELKEELVKEGFLKTEDPFIVKQTFYSLEKRIPDFPKGKRNSVGWRIYSLEEKIQMKELIRKEYFN